MLYLYSSIQFFLNWVIAISNKSGFWQLIKALCTQKTLVIYYISTAAFAVVWIDEVNESGKPRFEHNDN